MIPDPADQRICWAEARADVNDDDGQDADDTNLPDTLDWHER